MNILIVCTGNTCRSPMAEAILKRILSKKGILDKFCIRSRGLGAFNGESASENAKTVCKEVGLDIEAHRSQRISPDDIKWADKIFVMNSAHRDLILNISPDTSDYIKSLDVPDPFGGSLEDYRICFNVLGDLLDVISWE